MLTDYERTNNVRYLAAKISIEDILDESLLEDWARYLSAYVPQKANYNDSSDYQQALSRHKTWVKDFLKIILTQAKDKIIRELINVQHEEWILKI